MSISGVLIGAQSLSAESGAGPDPGSGSSEGPAQAHLPVQAREDEGMALFLQDNGICNRRTLAERFPSLAS